MRRPVPKTLIAGAAAAFACVLFTAAAFAQIPAGANPAFIGRWCVQGDPARVATIAAANLGLQLTNESGSTSPGQVAGFNPNTITALSWNLVQGTISADGRSIAWTNGTTWKRCSPGGAVATLDGTWYAAGDPNRACSISQQLGALNFVNEQGASASGHYDGPLHLTAMWQGNAIGGTISADGSRISWDNGTVWLRNPRPF
jgi:hypothetical protein